MADAAPSSQRLSQSKVRLLIITVITAVLYALVSELPDLLLGHDLGLSFLMWTPAGLGLAAVLIWGPVVLPGILLGALVRPYENGISGLEACGVALGAVVQAYLPTLLLKRVGFRRDLGRPRDVLDLVALGGFLGTLVGYTIAAMAQWASGSADLGSILLDNSQWWQRHLSGVLLVCPLILVWESSAWPQVQKRNLPGTGLFLAAAGFFVLAVFRVVPVPPSLDLILRPFSLFPILIWVAFRYGQRGQVAAMFVVGVIASYATLKGIGPFNIPTRSIAESNMAVQPYLSLTAVTGMVLASVVASRLAAEAALLASEQLLRKREAEFRATFELSGAGHFQIDLASRRLAMVNRKFCDQTGYTADELAAMTDADLTHPEDRLESETALAKLSAGHGVDEIRLEKRFVRKSGEAFWSLTTATLIRDQSGRALRAVAVVQDISEWRAAEAQMRRAKEAAEAASLAKSRFLANMSHEIRTPLGAVLGFSDLLVDHCPYDVEREMFVSAIKRNGQLLSTIINDILDLSKVEAGKLEFERQPVLLAELIRDLADMLQPRAVEKNLTLRFITAPGTPVVVYTDPNRLRQIVVNIIGNALKFSESGEIIVEVRLALAALRRLLTIRVRDRGVGISPEQAQRLFEPFSQGDVSTTRRFGGTGLGLALSRQLAKALGGDVALLTSAPGEGSVFEISIDPGDVSQTALALGAKDDSSPRVNPSPSVVPTIPKRLLGLRVLLVDDAADNQLLVERILRLSGAEVDVAANGEQAVARVTAAEYDALLMDLQMPVMDGYQATAEIRRRGFAMPIIALSAHVMTEERHRCLSAGFSEHLGKPVDRQALIDCLVVQVAQRRLQVLGLD